MHDVPYSEEAVSSVPHVPYEFPNGFNDEYGHERFKIPEALFDPNSKTFVCIYCALVRCGSRPS